MTAILGGGISGLSAAFYALRNPKLGTLTLIEASNHLGGWIRSVRSPDDTIFEKGPRTIRATNNSASNNLFDLIDDLKLSEAIIPIPSTHPAAKKRLIYVDKELYELPGSFLNMFTIHRPFRRPLITTLWNDLRAPQVKKEDESIYDFVERRLGKDIAEYVISPMVCGICAGDAKKISVNFLMKNFFEAEQQYGTILKGMWKKNKKSRQEKKDDLPKKIFDDGEVISTAEKFRMNNWTICSLQNGLEELPKKLAEHLSTHKVKINLNERCNNIIFKPDCVELEVNGKINKCSRVISSLPAKQLATLIQHQHPQLASELNAIPMVTVGSVNLQFNDNVLPMEAFGFLVPPREKLPILGVIFDSCIFPQGPSTVLTVLMGGAWFEDHFGQNPSDEHLLSVALENLKTILNIKDTPVAVDVSILRDCIPQYIVGHKERVNRIRNYISSNNIPLGLCGSSYQGVSISEVILSAKNAIDDISNTEEKCNDAAV